MEVSSVLLVIDAKCKTCGKVGHVCDTAGKLPAIGLDSQHYSLGEGKVESLGMGGNLEQTLLHQELQASTKA